MQPNIIRRDKLYIAGLTGDGVKTGEAWNHFDTQYKENPFPKADENGYEIRFYNGDKTAVRGQDIHVGFAAESADPIDRFTTIVLPATDYAVFDVYVAKGYDSSNAAMNHWLADNSAQYTPRMMNGSGFVVECYDEKFKNGDKPDSIVELWVPIYRSCQSCGMPLDAEMVFGKDSTESVFGKEKDGSLNQDYCYLCYVDGAFSVDTTMEGMIESCVPYTSNNNPWPDAETARKEMQKFFPKLTRWAK